MTPTIQFQCLPPDAFVSDGKLTSVKEGAWRQYLESVIHNRFPSFEAQFVAGQPPLSHWQENDCLFTSLRVYLSEQFCMLIPADNLFKIYNSVGQGLLIGELVEAISALIEPLGFEIERIMAPDEELRHALNDPRAVGYEHAGVFHGRDGIGMINIKAGYNHAFYWKNMDASKFTREQFRLALLVKRQEQHQHPARWWPTL
jgi:hypothetical protein